MNKSYELLSVQEMVVDAELALADISVSIFLHF